MTTSVSFQTTLHVRDHCLCLAAHRAARALSRRFDQALRECGLTHGQFSLLMSLNRPEPPAVGAVSRLLGLDRTTLTAALKPLVRDGRVEVQVDPADRRSRRLRLTDTGREALAQALPVWQKTHAQIDAELIAAERRAGAAARDLESGLRSGLAVLAESSFPARKGNLP